MTTNAKGADPRNMTRSALARHLRTEVTDARESRKDPQGSLSVLTRGWALRWTNSPYADTYVEWIDGTGAERNQPQQFREALRDAALDEIESVLKGLGYVTKREHAVVLVLRRMGG